MKPNSLTSTWVPVVISVMLSACSLIPLNRPTPTPSGDPIPTRPVQPLPTGSAADASPTQAVPKVIATLPNPATSVVAATKPTTSTTAPKATAIPGKPAEPCIFKATFVLDVNVPDGTQFPPGAQFTKTWRVRNDSNCAWGAGSDVKGMITVDGEKLAKVNTVDFPEPIQPGQTIEVSIPMLAPDKEGTYKSEWLFAAVNGASFGVGKNGELPLSAQIVVNKNATVPPAGGAPVANCTVKVGFVADVSIPDNTKVTQGSKFTKTWRLRNDGTCPWGPGTTVDTFAFSGGDKLGASDSTSLPAAKPGEVKDISVDFTAPNAIGTFRSEWKLKKSDGGLVGLGATGGVAMYVLVNVK